MCCGVCTNDTDLEFTDDFAWEYIAKGLDRLRGIRHLRITFLNHSSPRGFHGNPLDSACLNDLAGRHVFPAMSMLKHLETYVFEANWQIKSPPNMPFEVKVLE
jgi:hypothetical protein